MYLLRIWGWEGLALFFIHLALHIPYIMNLTHVSRFGTQNSNILFNRGPENESYRTVPQVLKLDFLP